MISCITNCCQRMLQKRHVILKKKNKKNPKPVSSQNYSEFPKSLITRKKGTTPFLVVFFRASATSSLSET